MHSSKRQIPPPAGARATSYSRFIPREELGAFAAWHPEALAGGAPTPKRRTSDAEATSSDDAEANRAKNLLEARQSGYQDGYRDGLIALESFKRSYSNQITAQLGTVTQGYLAQIDQLHEQLAQALAATATQLAAQIVRSELSTRPELITSIAQEAVDTLMMSAKHITLRVHPDDHALVAQGLGETLTARGARLVTDATLTCGGCVVESNIGVIDATLESRWRNVVATLGHESEWGSALAPTGPKESESGSDA